MRERFREVKHTFCIALTLAGVFAWQTIRDKISLNQRRLFPVAVSGQNGCWIEYVELPEEMISAPYSQKVVRARTRLEELYPWIELNEVSNDQCQKPCAGLNYGACFSASAKR